MRTVRKSLFLLNLFNENTPEYGLSELARAAGYDKATTLRMLAALCDFGMVEKHPETKKYRLGAGVLRLARVREATFPVARIVEPILQDLVQVTGETAHFSLASGGGLATLGIAETHRANRINIQSGEFLPMHCTGSGLAYLAFSPESAVDEILSKPLKAYSGSTETDPAALRALIAETKITGVGIVDQGYDAEVVGIAAPLFDWTGFACGAVAVALPHSRMSDELAATIKPAISQAAVDITRAFGAKPHPVILANAGAK
jgi:DNA-binding IclR family transcriptional regulator